MLKHVAAILSLFASAPATAGSLPRVASLGICADQLAIMLADPTQIVSLSDQSRSEISHYAEQAKSFPQNRGTVEEFIAAGIDVLLISDSLDLRKANLMRSFGIKVYQLPFASSWDEIFSMTQEIGTLLDQKERADLITEQIKKRLAEIKADHSYPKRPLAVYYRSDGGGAGKGTFVNLAIEAAGFQNLQIDLGYEGWTGVPAEQLVFHEPDLYVVSYFDRRINSTNILRRNPIVWEKARKEQIVNIPGKYWNCGSPLLIHAVEKLRELRKNFEQGRSKS